MSALTRRSQPRQAGPVQIAEERDADGNNGTSQLSLLSAPTARRSDPPTSQAAAASAAKTASATERKIIDVLRQRSATTDEIADVLGMHAPTVGTRISGLAKRGLVRPLGERLSNRGRPASVWHLVDRDVDLDRLEDHQARPVRRLPREAKVERLLADGRTTIVRRDAESVIAKVRGDHGVYDVECDGRGRWECSCACYGARCTHVEAVALVSGIGGVR